MARKTKKLADGRKGNPFRNLLLKADKLAEAGLIYEAFTVYEKALNSNPGNARLILEIGDFSRRWGLMEEASRFYEAALQFEPFDLEIRNKYGLSLMHQGQFDEAIEQFKTAIEMTQGQGTAQLWGNLGITCAEKGDIQNGAIFLEEALRLDPSHPSSLANIGELYARLGEHDKSMRYLKRSLKHLPDDAQARFNLASITLRTGDLKRGWSMYENRLDPRIPSAALYQTNLPRWTGKPLGPGELLIAQEQGLGDQIMFCTMLPSLKDIAPKPVLEIQDRLIPLMQRSFPDFTVHEHAKQVVMGKGIYQYEWLNELEVKPKFWTPMGSLGRYVRQKHEDFPSENAYLKPDPERMAHWRDWLAGLPGGIRIGICWRSMNLAAKRLKNYMSLDQYEPLFSLPNVTWVRLQYDDCEAEMQEIKERYGITVHAPPGLDQFNDLEGVCALISGLDMVISAPTVVRTFAGALGVDTLLLAVSHLWTALGVDHKEAFFPSVTMCHPEHWGDWDDVLVQAVGHVKAKQKRMAA